jgi:acetoacetate decarboxylase
MVVEYLADPAEVAPYMPRGVTPDPEGRAAAIFGSWQSCTDGGVELLDPIRSQYHEFYIVLAGTLGDQKVARCPYCWVDRDFSLVRGLIQGYPKKLASIAMTWAGGVGRAASPLAPGVQFGASCAAEHRRLAEMRLRLTTPADEGSWFMRAPLVHTRRFPAWDPAGAGVDELVAAETVSQEFLDVWHAAGELSLFSGPNHGLAKLRPRELGSACRMSYAETLLGGRLITTA